MAAKKIRVLATMKGVAEAHTNSARPRFAPRFTTAKKAMSKRPQASGGSHVGLSNKPPSVVISAPGDWGRPWGATAPPGLGEPAAAAPVGHGGAVEALPSSRAWTMRRSAALNRGVHVVKVRMFDLVGAITDPSVGSTEKVLITTYRKLPAAVVTRTTLPRWR